VIISVLVHGVVIGVAIIAPLVASDVLPAIQNPIAPFVRAFRPADIPLSAPPRIHTPRPRVGAPTVAPFGIAPEKPQPPSSEGPTVPFGTEGLTTIGLPAGFGSSESLSPIPPPPAPAPPPSSIVKPVPVGGRIRTPGRLAYVVPVYPVLAQTARIEGDVTLEAIIGTDGTVQNLRVVHGVQLLDQAALDAVRRWRYTPTLLNGVPVPIVMTVTVSFRLTR
jgi:protein TonB